MTLDARYLDPPSPAGYWLCLECRGDATPTAEDLADPYCEGIWCETCRPPRVSCVWCAETATARDGFGDPACPIDFGVWATVAGALAGEISG